METQQTQNSCSKQLIHFVNQLSMYGAVAKWCYQFGLTKEEKRRANFYVDYQMLTSLKTEEVQLSVSLPTMTLGNRMRENVLSFEALASKIQLTQLCEKAYFQYCVTAGKMYKVRPNGDDGWRTITPPCPEHTFSRSFPQSQVVSAFPEGTIIGQVLEVRIRTTPSILKPKNTSYVVKELRSSNELLTDLQRSERSELPEEEKGSNSIKETCASPPSNPPGHTSLFICSILVFSAFKAAEKTIPTNEKMEGYSCPFSRRRRFGKCSLQNGYKNGALLRPR